MMIGWVVNTWNCNKQTNKHTFHNIVAGTIWICNIIFIEQTEEHGLKIGDKMFIVFYCSHINKCTRLLNCQVNILEIYNFKVVNIKKS